MASIAIVGTGISGLGAAYLLHPGHDITVYEKSADVGGHTRTRMVRHGDRELAVDTGFIVFNYRNYPELAGLFKHLNVPVQKSNMSFGVTANGGALEWSAQSPNSLFGQRRNLVNPRFYRFLLDIVKFNARAQAAVKADPAMTMGELIARLRLGEWFSQYYILPMGGAIWSCPLPAILAFPAKEFIDFFARHGLLTVTQQPQWYTVTGGSQVYVDRLIAPFADRIRTSSGVTSVTRADGKVQVTDARGETRAYDRIVFACHADEALGMLADASPEEQEALSPFTYQRNVAVLHKDVTIMPKRRLCWASWVYHAEENAPGDVLPVTYWMNQLQAIDEAYPIFVTLNPLRPVRKEDVFDTHAFEHPVYSMAAVNAQKRLPLLQGKRNSWYCGAYHGNGFHEDGLKSALAVAKSMGVEAPWH